MIRLHPEPDARHNCPLCKVPLEVCGWYIPGMRNLAELECPSCRKGFYGDLPAGHGLYYPMLLEREKGIVHDRNGVPWFANWLRESYTARTSSPMDFVTDEFRPLKQPLLLNCLDRLYGHCLLKLLNAQYYIDHRPEFDVIALVPRFLRWMVPEGVAAIWAVDLPLARGNEWNDWLAAEIKRRLEPLRRCWLSIALSHPHPDDFDIERFTRVRPFPIEEWAERLGRPTVTFVWREDRVWRDTGSGGRCSRLAARLKRKLGLSPAFLEDQRRRVVALAGALRKFVPDLDFAVAGLGRTGRLPDWIADLRTIEVGEIEERAWCERYARSHVVTGVHGSNMLLPSAHAGAVLELVPADRWGNLVQDVLVAPQDVRQALWRYRFLPIDASPATVALVAVNMLRHIPSAVLHFTRPWADHEAVTSDPHCVARRRCEIAGHLRRFHE